MIDKVRAPFNFVPLADKIYYPDWSDAVSLDVPFEDGLCGQFELTLNAETPLIVGGAHDQNSAVSFFRTPDETYAIPGDTIRGMVRNVLEIASFGRFSRAGKFSRVADKRFSVREPSSKFYSNRVAEQPPRTHNGLKLFAPKTRAGWLEVDKTSGAWTIVPTEFARIEMEPDLFSGISRKPAWFTKIHAPGKAQKKYPVPARKKYEDWAALGYSLTLDFGVKALAPQKHNNKYLAYRKATAPSFCLAGATPGPVPTGKKRGTLVFTGQPGPNKHMEFIFFDFPVPPTPMKLTEDVVHGFMSAHKVSPDHPKTDFDWWESRRRSGKIARIPVFYLEETAGTVTAFGMAQMPKIAYRCGVHEMVRHTSPEHMPENNAIKPDLAETIFGFVSDSANSSLRHRIDFSLATPHEQPRLHPPVTRILSSPKASYYPSYVEQAEGKQGNLGRVGGYKTYDDPHARIRGWKRYPVHAAVSAQPANDADQDDTDHDRVSVQFTPLRTDSRFTCTVRFHNLRPLELGAIAWALTFGACNSENQLEYRHALGMAKPFGFGRVRIEPGVLTAETNNGEAALDLGQYAAKYEEAMTTWYSRQYPAGKSWADSDQLRELLAMADPQSPATAELRYMQMGMNPQTNDYLQAKGRTANKDRNIPQQNSLYLARYSELAASGAAAHPATALSAAPPPVASIKVPDVISSTIDIDALCLQGNRSLLQVLHEHRLALEIEKLQDRNTRTTAAQAMKRLWLEQHWWNGADAELLPKLAKTMYEKILRDRN